MFARLGEQTGQMPLMLSRAAKQLSIEVQRRAMHLATILEPLADCRHGCGGAVDCDGGLAAHHSAQSNG